MATTTGSRQCQRCGGGLLHELLTIRLSLPEGESWNLCPACASAALDRLVDADAEALEILEGIWAIGESA